MPYVKQVQRERLSPLTSSIADTDVRDVGELNYVITTLVNRFAKFQGKSYSTYNGIVGVLESAKAEFYRRAVSKYEDAKVTENGDVYND